MPERRGYRSERLNRRRRSRAERRQAWLLYLMAIVVAFVAVLGAWYVAGRYIKKPAPPRKGGYLAAIQLTTPGRNAPVAALLVVQDPEGDDPGVYLVPPDLLLDGPDDAYVFAADAMAEGVLAQDLGRVVNAPVDAVFTMPASTLAALSGSDGLRVSLDAPVSVDVDGQTQTIKNGDVVPTADLPAILAAPGENRPALTTLQTALVKATLDAAALRPAAERSRLAGPSPSPSAGPSLNAVLARITAGRAQVQRFPAATRVAEGQFAFVPDAEEIMAAITRRSPAYHADVTVEVLNGSGKIGVAEAVVQQLSSLDVNLPRPLNADRFDYRQTQILAGPDTLPVARDIRAILGRGVVLEGSDLPQGTIQVIVGNDVQPPQPSPKDQS